MQLDWDVHFREIVIPAWQAYLAAERRLTAAAKSGDWAAEERAGFDALREGGAAAFYVHHYADVVVRNQPYWLPNEITKVRPTLTWLGESCTRLRTGKSCDDVDLLRDVAEALKHAILTHNLEARRVAANEAVLVVGTGYGELPYGEGKFGGTVQVVVLASGGARALSAILQNVIDAWRVVSGLPLPEIGQP